MQIRLNEGAVTEYLIRYVQDCSGDELAELAECLLGIEDAVYDDDNDWIDCEYEPEDNPFIEPEEIELLLEDDEPSIETVPIETEQLVGFEDM